MSIPLNSLIRINPYVVSVGNNPNSLPALMLSQNEIIPPGDIIQHDNAQDVGKIFGYHSDEYRLANLYFNGFTNATRAPALLLIGGFSETPLLSARLIGTPITTLSAEWPKLTGELDMTIDDKVFSANGLSFEGVTTPSLMAELLSTQFECQVKYFTGPNRFDIFSPTIGKLSSISFASGSLADILGLSAQSGATIFEGKEEFFPRDQLQALYSKNPAFACLFCAFEPSEATYFDIGGWVSAQNNQILGILHDSRPTALVEGTGLSFAERIRSQNLQGIASVWKNADTAVFIASVVGSLDLNRQDGRQNLAFRRQSGFRATVDKSDEAVTLERNGYNFYGQFASATREFQFLYPGSVSGNYAWIDSYVCQIWMRRVLQNNLTELMMAIGQIPYNEDGKGLIASTIQPAVEQFLRFGAIRSGTRLAQSQVQILQGQGLSQDVLTILQTRGWYLLVDMVGTAAEIRLTRGSPPISFWYTDGQSVQNISMNSVEVQ